MKILIACEPSESAVDPINLELLAAAQGLSGDNDEVVALIAADAGNVRDTLGGASRVICTPVAAETARTPENAQATLLDAVTSENPDLVILPYTALGLDLGPWLAGKTDMGLVSYVSGLERDGDSLIAVSQLYGGKLLARSELETPCILSIMPGSFEPAEPAPGAEPVMREAAPVESRMTLVSVEAPDLSGLDLTKSERILCVGRGISDENGVEKARHLAGLLHADLAGSRPVVDSGMLEKQRQVGKSGQKVKPAVYIALGVSGAPEHLEGMSASDTIVAVNTDPDAPIFNVADYRSICDLFEFIDAVEELLADNPLPGNGAA